MIIRIRSKEGNHRYELLPDDDVQLLIKKILETAKHADAETLALSTSPSGGERLVKGMKGTLKQLGLNHGDLLFASYKETPTANTSNTSAGRLDGLTISSPTPSTIDQLSALSPIPASTSSGPSNSVVPAWKLAVEDPVDQILEKETGKISRPRDAKFCRHGDRSMCDYCMPFESYDPKYHKEHSIKHLSFQAYLRKINSQTNKPESGSSYIPPMEEPDYRVKIPCPSSSHAPFPVGICSKCQPSAITLQLQQYRMVDHVEFASPQLIENLLSFWRKTGCQRFGYLIGRFERYDLVPLGVKAVVEAIHEPPQHGEVDGIQVGLPWDEEGKVEQVANACDLKIVGMIYTDLVSDTSNEEAKKVGKVVCKRHGKSFFLSSLETIFSAKEQLRRRNASKYCASGQFGSKFVTCVVSGNEDGGIDVSSYQVSEQAVGMVQAGMIEASVEPGTVRLREDDRRGQKSGGVVARYVPDVFYRYKNAYGIDVKENAKPCFPVDYLLVSLTHGFPATTSSLFKSPVPFSSANRTGWQDQSMDKVIAKVAPLLAKLPPGLTSTQSGDDGKGKGRAVDEDVLMELQLVLSDWDLLVFLDSAGIFAKPDIEKLAKVAVAKDKDGALKALDNVLKTAAWQTLAMIAHESSSVAAAPRMPNAEVGGVNDDVDMGQFSDHHDDGGGDGDGSVVCPHCTFANTRGTADCAICGLPISG